jgi:hypothetical protein
MVEANSHRKLLLTSILDIYKVFKHIDVPSIGIWYQPYTVIPTLLGSDFGPLGHLWSQNDVIMSWLQFWYWEFVQVLINKTRYLLLKNLHTSCKSMQELSTEYPIQDHQV